VNASAKVEGSADFDGVPLFLRGKFKWLQDMLSACRSAGPVSRGSESGLLLTPHAEASEIDDGYLTALEIAALRLDADSVILSPQAHRAQKRYPVSPLHSFLRWGTFAACLALGSQFEFDGQTHQPRQLPN
jgi:hypothetical protein